jgi:hypothetical protein
MIESGESNFIFLGPACCETRTKEVCEVAIEGFNPNLTDLFEYYAEPFNISQETLELIQRHKQCVYLIFDSPSLDKARTATRFANAFLRLGGMAIMIRSAGIIHDRRTWFETVETLTDDGLYFLFVNLLSSKEQYHSCGMQNFGLPDAEVSSVDRQDAARILNEFNLYRLAGCRSNSGPGSHARRSALKQAKTAAWEPPLLTCPTDC